MTLKEEPKDEDEDGKLEVLPPMSVGRSGHGCTIVKVRNKKYLVVAAGLLPTFNL